MSVVTAPMSSRSIPALCVFLVLGVVAGCGGDPEPTPPVHAEGDACDTSEDCGGVWLCVLDRCRSECAGYSECPIGSTCLADVEREARGCRLEDEATCDAGCPSGTQCSGGRCRAECASSDACGGTACIEAESLCEEPDETRVECPDEGFYCSSGVCADYGCDLEIGVALGEMVTCVLRDSGAVDCAGSDAGGLLGDGPTAHPGDVRARLASIVLDEPVQQVGAGEEHACALLFGGEVRCWGAGDEGQTGAAGATDTPTLAIAPPSDESSSIDELAVGASHACVRRLSGVVECWGSDAASQLGDTTEHAPCASGAPCSAAPVVVAGLDDVIDLDAGRDATCAVRQSGIVVCWGHTGIDVAGTTPCTLEGGATAACHATPVEVPVIGSAYAVSVGDAHACALDDDGVVWCWGDSSMGQAGAASGVIGPTEVMLPVASVSIAAGRAHTCALGVDEAVRCWGANDASQRGAPDVTGGATPTRVEGLPRTFEITSGSDHVCAQTTDREIWCWGRDAEGQLARGATSAVRTPARVTR